MKTLFGSPSDTQSTHTQAALDKAFATADEKVPEKQRAAEFLASFLEPGLLPLLERRAAILAGLANADAGLDALAAAQLAPDASAERSSSMPLDVNHLTLAALEREIAVKRRAIQMQRDVVTRTGAEWSRVVCQQLAPVHRRQVQRIWAAVQELSSALIDHQQFVDGLRDGEVANFPVSLRPMLFTRDSMRLNDESSSASLWMNDAKDNRLLD